MVVMDSIWFSLGCANIETSALPATPSCFYSCILCLRGHYNGGGRGLLVLKWQQILLWHLVLISKRLLIGCDYSCFGSIHISTILFRGFLWPLFGSWPKKNSSARDVPSQIVSWYSPPDVFVVFLQCNIINKYYYTHSDQCSLTNIYQDYFLVRHILWIIYTLCCV